MNDTADDDNDVRLSGPLSCLFAFLTTVTPAHQHRRRVAHWHPLDRPWFPAMLLREVLGEEEDVRLHRPRPGHHLNGYPLHYLNDRGTERASMLLFAPSVSPLCVSI